MWISYAAIVVWALVEVTGVPALPRDPIGRVAADAAAVVETVASASVAIVALGAARLQDVDPSRGARFPALAAGSDPERLLFDAPTLLAGCDATPPHLDEMGCPRVCSCEDRRCGCATSRLLRKSMSETPKM